MRQKELQTGSAMPIVIAIIAVVAVVLLVVNYQSRNNSPVEEAEMVGPDTMHEDSMEEDAMMHDDAMMEKDEGVMENSGDEMMQDEQLSLTGQVIAGNTTKLIDFNQADFEKAKASDKLVVLYYYANWCPICREETQNSLYPAFNELETDQVVGFRVNFNDNETDQNEEDLAREHGVAYQHTKVFLKNGERVLKSPESWSKDRYFEEIEKFIN